MSLDPMLEVLRREGRQSLASLAERFSMSESEVSAKVAAWEADGLILGYQAVIDTDRAADTGVSAFIEVKLTPERGGGFDRLASRIAKFEQVESCYLASGGYDLMVLVSGADLMSVARFVSEKLSSMEGVLSTATHFRLKTYKENGFLFGNETQGERLPVTP
ncbi:Lrp/AsnC family transcriptional regulator [Roseibacillus ishigakijimensis]|uniref:Lrp/AsnC family transcriptional regulator n=2 Tax=Roseibacillus ishigakijimensis TaxID=454146 RepID=A0A934RRL3_9BACT|nr:Lrp/AsnC family transcriptional regulator [Roseibacillus ishigakijimensis]